MRFSQSYETGERQAHVAALRYPSPERNLGDRFRTQKRDTGFDVILPTIAQSCGYSVDREMNAFDQIVASDACPVALQ